MSLVGRGTEPWGSYVWLFVGSGLWLVRSLADLGLSRRPLLEPNLNATGLACAAVGLLGLMVAESVILPLEQGIARNPADTSGAAAGELAPPAPGADPSGAAVAAVLSEAPLPVALKRNPPQVIVSRVLAGLAHLALVVCLYLIGSRHFDRPILGLSMGVCYLLSPYTRIAVVDSGQLVPAALVVAGVLAYRRPALAGVFVGLAGGWMPPCLGLLPLWAGFFGWRNARRFLLAAALVVGVCAVLGHQSEFLSAWARALGARSLSQAGLLLGVEGPHGGSFWTRIDPVYRLPVLIAYLALVVAVAFWPVGKNLGELVSLSAAVLVASQFWYLDEGGTMILLYLPLLLLMMFRPNLSSKMPPSRPSPKSDSALTAV
jgi:hypothetical protein